MAYSHKLVKQMEIKVTR